MSKLTISTLNTSPLWVYHCQVLRTINTDVWRELADGGRRI